MLMLIGIILWLAGWFIFPPLSVLISIGFVWHLMAESENRELESQGRTYYWNTGDTSEATWNADPCHSARKQS